MRVERTVLVPFLLAALAVSTVRAQEKPAATNAQLRPNVAVDYSFLRSNAPPEGCGCFSLNGGSINGALPVQYRGWAVVGEVFVTHAGNIGSAGSDLTLTGYLAGLRDSVRIGRTRFTPFGQFYLGAAHASGGLVEGLGSTGSTSSTSFAAEVGGGVDMKIARRFSWRIADADYLATTFYNGVNNHQNIIKVSSGLVVHF